MKNMIKRYYFMSATKAHSDGSLGYGFHSITMDYVSWFPRHNKVYEDAVKHLEKSMEDVVSTNNIQIIAFNRI